MRGFLFVGDVCDEDGYRRMLLTLCVKPEIVLILTGEPGTEKTEFVNGFVARMVGDLAVHISNMTRLLDTSEQRFLTAHTSYHTHYDEIVAEHFNQVVQIFKQTATKKIYLRYYKK